MIGRLVVALLMVVACCSCTPAHRQQHEPAPSIAVPSADRRLLQRLALADPDGSPPPAFPQRPLAAAAPPFLAGAASIDDEQRATDCLTAAVYYEARSEPLDGQRAVAQVVLNRVRDRAFPASVCSVVYQRSTAGCQFSFVCDGSMNHPIEPRAWQTAQAVAQAALGGSVYAPVGAATHYHTTAILPWWAGSLARIGTIGSHIFYRWGNRLGSALSFRQAYSGHERGAVMAAAIAQAPDRDDPMATAESGVTVHRGPPPTLASAPTTPTAPAIFGVRVHRGALASAEALVDPGAYDAPVAN